MTRRQRQIELAIYVLGDFLAAAAAWGLFFLFRKSIEGLAFGEGALVDRKLLLGIGAIPLGWVVFYALFDKYTDVFRLSRLATLARTFFLSFVGVVFLFFSLMLAQVVTGYRSN